MQRSTIRKMKNTHAFPLAKLNEDPSEVDRVVVHHGRSSAKSPLSMSRDELGPEAGPVMRMALEIGVSA